MNKIHTIIFDLDGTLSDSALLTAPALQKIAPEHGLPIPSEEAIRSATGTPNPEFYYTLFPDTPRDKVRTIGNKVEKEELRILPSLGDKLLFKGSRELLEHLSKNGIRLCIASTGDRDHVFSILNETGIINLFNTISYGKPNKTGMLREIIGDDNKNSYIMVGDMIKDYQAARANGILSVGVCYGYCKRDLADFDYYINTPSELLHMIQEE